MGGCSVKHLHQTVFHRGEIQSSVAGIIDAMIDGAERKTAKRYEMLIREAGILCVYLFFALTLDINVESSEKESDKQQNAWGSHIRHFHYIDKRTVDETAQ